MSTEHFDVLIIGAGLSGVGAAVHLQKDCPGKTYAILEGREAIGGTWDLFRYPGIRSDSDMHTLGYDFKPWTEAKAIADGPSIRNYVRETADEHGVAGHIRFGHKVTSAAWDSETALWTVEAVHAATGKTKTFTTNFYFACSGYYSYAEGHRPDFENEAAFQGDIVHPQFWPEDLDYSGKKVVIIGSGATAVTLVPEMAKTAAHVTMLQRSPTYVVSRPAKDKVANALRAVLPDMWAYNLTRARNILFQRYFYHLTRTKPEKTKERILNMVREELGPDFDVETHFTPAYNPWDQRLCLVPDSDLFHALRDGSASVATDHIDRFTETGIALKSGATLDADIIVVATGLKLEMLGGVKLTVDGATVDIGETVTYRGAMFSGVPNLASVFGYINASWTLKADLISGYVCRLLKHMDETGTSICTPVLSPGVATHAFLEGDFSSGYFARARDVLPKQGDQDPWTPHQNYAKDKRILRHAPMEDGAMTFTNPTAPAAANDAEAASVAAE